MTGAVERRLAARRSPARAAARLLAAVIAAACATHSAATEAPSAARKAAPAARGNAPGEQQAGCYDRTRCVEQVTRKTGTECGSDDSMKVVWRNTCDDAVKVVVCFVRPDRSLECGQSRIRPGREQTDYACHATAVHVAAFHVDDSYECAENEKERWAERPGS